MLKLCNKYKQSYLAVMSILITVIFVGCNNPPETLFVLHSKDKTGIDFSNTIFESDTFNIFSYDYIYNGGGVAIADFNNDGLQDIFFTGNMVPNRLYLNEGKFEFRDVTAIANVNLPGRWNGGVTVVDINNDGWQDLYVCATMEEDSLLRANMLYLHKGVNEDNIPVFEEVAEKYGIADKGYSVMATFFDYDRDEDLDLYVLTNKDAKEISSNYRTKIVDGSASTNDRLYRNNGNGTFTNVTKEAGILYEGYGLGLAISDFNNDGWSDIYVSNDFTTNDLFYVNNQDGTFTNQSAQWIAHQSQFSMGNDAADFNNDGLTDIITLDMLPETNDRKKTMINNKNYLTYINNEKYGYEYQYIRNMLHLNNGMSEGVGFSEIGQLAGVFQTEWSWSPLFADFDNDGNKDLAITNGFPRDITDKDFVTYHTDVGAYVSNSDLLDSVPIIKIPNYVYRNNGDLTFTDVSKEWGFTQPSFSNGAAYADFDNDGDLDYVVNNINDNPLIYENKSGEKKPQANHYLRIKFVGPPLNKNAIGTKVMLYERGNIQVLEQYVSRGYLSSVEQILHFGLGVAAKVDSLIITWPDGNMQKVDNIKADILETIKYNPEDFIKPHSGGIQKQKLFSDVSRSLNLLFKHEEDDKIDYNLQRTLPHKFSQSGPGMATGDITGDGLEDVIIGGSVGHYFTLFIQSKDGLFSRREFSSPSADKKEEDEGLLLFDADNDSDLDLYVVSGGIEFAPDSIEYQDRLYKNDGHGKFTLEAKALPNTRSSGSCVRAADVDGDNDLDLFVGGRVVPGSYPYPSRSYLLRNDNGVFVDVTESIFPDLIKLGMITDALFTDYDNDGRIDLTIVGEFLPVMFFKNENGHFITTNSTGIEKNVGWWNSITGGDFDNDGDIDYIAGNLGLNNAYKVTDTSPLCVFAKDFDKNGSIDPVLGCYIKKSLSDDKMDLYPVHFWDEINSQSPRFRQQFSKYKQYGNANVQTLFTEEELSDALILKANYMETSYIENLGNGKFKMKPLPLMTQFAPVNGLVVDDINYDGNLDVLMVGNDYGNEVFIGRYDALTGLVLLGDGTGNFEVVKSAQSGFNVSRDAKALVKLSGLDEDLYLATRNRDSISVFAITRKQVNKHIEPKNSDSWAEIIYEDGRKRKVELYYGAGYLSQSTRRLRWDKGIKSIILYEFNNKSRQLIANEGR